MTELVRNRADAKITVKNIMNLGNVTLSLTFLFLSKLITKTLKTGTPDCKLEVNDKVDVFFDPAGKAPTLLYGRSCNLCAYSKTENNTSCNLFHRT